MQESQSSLPANTILPFPRSSEQRKLNAQLVEDGAIETFAFTFRIIAAQNGGNRAHTIWLKNCSNVGQRFINTIFCSQTVYNEG